MGEAARKLIAETHRGSERVDGVSTLRLQVEVFQNRLEQSRLFREVSVFGNPAGRPLAHSGVLVSSLLE
jgi:hypothetical protein